MNMTKTPDLVDWSEKSSSVHAPVRVACCRSEEQMSGLASKTLRASPRSKLSQALKL